MTNAIEFNHVSKLYRLGLVSTGALKDDLHRFWVTKILGREDPYLKIGATNDRTIKGESDYVWALKDIDFKVEQGDVVGIIGKNGAGKSTLLKILSRVTGPTAGTIKARGRIGSLLEVGTGFHPEMTGRENIFMNGAILGMTHKEIQSKLDAIIDFSGCERYIDTPVKRYSSGMMVRLGFAVAAHLEPEILVVDEVLAVGDAEFQKKAIGKMKDVSNGDGRTVLFVSHNMGSIRSLCKKGILLKNGMIECTGEVNEVVDEYILAYNMGNCAYCEITDIYRGSKLQKDLEFVEAWMLNDVNDVATDETLKFRLKIKRNKIVFSQVNFGLNIFNAADVPVCVSISPLMSVPTKDYFYVDFSLKNHNLARGHYRMDFSVGQRDVQIGEVDYDVVEKVLAFDVEFLTGTSKEPYVFWPRTWGNHFVKDLECKIR